MSKKLLLEVFGALDAQLVGVESLSALIKENQKTELQQFARQGFPVIVCGVTRAGKVSVKFWFYIYIYIYKRKKSTKIFYRRRIEYVG